MKKGVRIINCARGGIIDELALKEALESGQVQAAAIDVFETEPDITASPLYGCAGNVTMTPHLGASTTEAQFNVAIDVAEQIKEVLSGGSAKAAINIPALKSAVMRIVETQKFDISYRPVYSFDDDNISYVESEIYTTDEVIGRISDAEISAVISTILPSTIAFVQRSRTTSGAPLVN